MEGDRVYVVTNRAEVAALALAGLALGNQGPYRDEARHMTPQGQLPLPLGPADADILWLFDMPSGVGIHPHDQAHSSVLIDGPYLYLNTGNGVDNTHRRIRCPDAPSLIVLDKATGRLLAQDGERIGPMIFHSTWSPPAMGEVQGRRLIFFCGGDGVCYAFEALRPSAGRGGVETLRRVWRCDLDPAAPKEDIHRYLTNRHVGPSNVKSTPVFWKGRVYVTVGGDIWWGKEPGLAEVHRRHHDRRPHPAQACAGPTSCRATAARRPRSATAWSTWPAAGRSIAWMPRRAGPAGSTTPAARSGPRPCWPTASFTSARGGATSGPWPPAARSASWPASTSTIR